MLNDNAMPEVLERLKLVLALQFLAVQKDQSKSGKDPLLNTIELLTDGEFRERITNYAFPMVAISGIGYDTGDSQMSNAIQYIWRIKLRFANSSLEPAKGMFDPLRGLWHIQKKIERWLREHPQLANNDKGICTGLQKQSRTIYVDFIDYNSATLHAVGLESFYTFFTDDVPFASTRQGVVNTISSEEYHGN